MRGEKTSNREARTRGQNPGTQDEAVSGQSSKSVGSSSKKLHGDDRFPKNPWGTLQPPRDLNAPSPLVYFPTSSPEHLVLCCRG